MNRRLCTNCQTAWPSVADHELEARHSCPTCGDELGPIDEMRGEVVDVSKRNSLADGRLAA